MRTAVDAASVVGSTEYDAYGKETRTSGTERSSQRFAGQRGYQNDDATGMRLLGARYYLPAIGRFLTPDPIGQEGGLNLYAYCGDSPLMRTDASGKDWASFLNAVSDLWAGRPATNAFGMRVRVGGWANILNNSYLGAPEDNAMTFSGTVHLQNEAAYRSYANNLWWQYHESYHVWHQGSSPGWLSLGSWGLEYVDAYKRWNAAGRPQTSGNPGAHDFHLLERAANAYADQFVDRRTGRLKHPANPWGGLPHQGWSSGRP